MSKREQILDAAKSCLTSVTGVDNSNIYRSRHAAFARAETPAIVIEPVSDTPDNPNIHRLQWVLTFQVAIIFRADIPDESADDTVASVHSKIMADSTLQTLVADLVPGPTDWDFEQADKQLVIVKMQFRASYQTGLNSLT